MCQLPTSVNNVTLLAFAAERPAATAFDRCILPAGPTAANPPHAAAAVDRCDRRADGQTNTQTDGRRTVTYRPSRTPGSVNETG